MCAYNEVHIYLLRLQCVICRLDGHILVAVDLDALQDHPFRIVFVCEGVEDDLKFGLGDLVSKSVHDRMVGLRCLCGILVAWAVLRSHEVHEQRSFEEDGRTEKPGEDAHLARSPTPQMIALSMLPVPTRLML